MKANANPLFSKKKIVKRNMGVVTLIRVVASVTHA
jgi:hypothetical protein